jgi:HPt (histidine-containing phosphotransfer) domain-containing protein
MMPPPPSDDPSQRSTPGNPEDRENRQQKLHVMLAGIWERSKTTLAERVEILRQVTAAAASNSLDDPGRARAVDSAHKLAGVLGTFGLPRGTELAREAEETFGRRQVLSPTDVARLGVLIDELDCLLKTANPSNSQAPE